MKTDSMTEHRKFPNRLQAYAFFTSVPGTVEHMPIFGFGMCHDILQAPQVLAHFAFFIFSVKGSHFSTSQLLFWGIFVKLVISSFVSLLILAKSLFHYLAEGLYVLLKILKIELSVSLISLSFSFFFCS